MVIGVNPHKTYLVSPIQRVEILRKMIDDSKKNMTRNVRVEGTYEKTNGGHAWTDGLVL